MKGLKAWTGFLGIFLCLTQLVLAQGTLKGTVQDEEGNPLFGAAVVIQGTTVGTQTDFDGKFEFQADREPPFVLEISYLGMEKQELQVTTDNIGKSLKVSLASSSVVMGPVDVTSTRITEKQKESPLTVESMGLAQIEEVPTVSFYNSLGSLKGVDMTTASMGFVIVNTRGFNSTRPVRSLQLIDGVDNQAPGLNFSLGNFVGVGELDIQKVELVVGASSAMYGPNAFNGVISMQTKDPFFHKGLSVSLKGGERGMFEGALRYARVIKNKEGEDKFAFKVVGSYFRANDWEADNLAPTDDSEVGVDNPGGYDAVNVYGDENFTPGSNNFNDSYGRRNFPGLGIYHRTGYEERVLVDYDTRNIKLGGSAHYKITDKIEALYRYNYGSGTTVYQGDNRYSLKGFTFQQHIAEIKQRDKFFIRAYHTRENAGDTYDAVFTALKLQEGAKQNRDWSNDYNGYYLINIRSKIENLPGYPNPNDPQFTQLWFGESREETEALAQSIIDQNIDSVSAWMNEAREFADGRGNPQSQNVKLPFFEPGTERFDSMFNVITSSTTFLDGGSKFYDKSSLTHVAGEYIIDPKIESASYKMNVTVGGSFRYYTPESKGTIFIDTGDVKVTNWEVGSYVGTEHRLFVDRLILTATMRVDKNENFDPLVSPAASAVFKYNENNVFRLSFSSAIRNPTLQDQYLYYNVGRAILLGNLNGFNDLVTFDSFFDAFEGQGFSPAALVYFDVDPVRPEKVRSLEVGYKGTLWKSLFIDASYYFSWYKDFLGYRIGADLSIDPVTNFVEDFQFYRVSANSSDQVTTQGTAIGLTYGFAKYYALTGNYSWNVLDRRGSTDEIIPAYNTPEHKFNIGLSGHDIVLKLGNTQIKHWGFNVTYKWVQGFLFEGSPQFTGTIPSYSLVDAQINYHITKIKSTIKVGATNLLNNKVVTTYGGPEVGRLAYVSLLIQLDKL